VPSFGYMYSCVSHTMTTTPVLARWEEASWLTHPSELAQSKQMRPNNCDSLAWITATVALLRLSQISVNWKIAMSKNQPASNAAGTFRRDRTDWNVAVPV
jgi:hypothetical protein